MQPLGNAGLPDSRTPGIHIVDLATALFPLEMSCTEIVIKTPGAEASAPLQKIRGGRMDENDWQCITDHLVAFFGRPLFIDGSLSPTIVEVRAKARHPKQRNNLQLVCVDYIQLTISGKKVEFRQLEVSKFLRQTEPLAKELEVPAIALSQLSRNAEQCEGGMSWLAGLREPGSLEQDADIVIILHRPELYTQSLTDEERGQTTLHILKYRNGQFNKINVLFQGHCSRFTNQPVAAFNPT